MKKVQKNVVYTFSKEKIDEFKDMSIRQRLQWLEVANRFINKTKKKDIYLPNPNKSEL